MEGLPRICIRHRVHPSSATVGSIAESRVPALISLTILAPALTATFATDDLYVSILIGMFCASGSERMYSMTGLIRLISSSVPMEGALGREDCPPTSITFVPASIWDSIVFFRFARSWGLF